MYLKNAKELSPLKQNKNISLNVIYIKEKLVNYRGETLIEVITSLALFAITMVTVATLFSAANSVFVKNFAIEEQLNKQIDKLVLETGLEIENSPTIRFTYSPTDGTTSNWIDKKIDLVCPESEGNALAKFRESTE